MDTKKPLTKQQFQELQKVASDIFEHLGDPQHKAWGHLTKEERDALHKKNEVLRNKQRTECIECDFYDPYPCADTCEHYKEYVERITYCEHKTIKEKRISDASHPLYMERLLMYNEFLNEKGEIEFVHNSVYNPYGRPYP